MKRVAGYMILIVSMLVIASASAQLLAGSPIDGIRIIVIVGCIGGLLVGLSWARANPPPLTDAKCSAAPKEEFRDSGNQLATRRPANKTKRISIFVTAALLVIIAAFVVQRSFHNSEHPTVVTFVVPCLPHPNASVSVTDSSIAAPLAAALNDLPAVLRVEMTSDFQRCRGVVRFRPDVEYPAAMQAVRERLAAATAKLPAYAGVPQILHVEPDALPQMWVAIKSNQLDIVHLTDLIRQSIHDRIARLPGVTEVELMGAADSEPTLWLDPPRLAQFGLTCDDVKRALTDAFKPADDSPHNSQSLDQSGLERIVVATRNGVPVYVGDVAHFKLEVRRSGFATVDGGSAVLLAISAKTDEPTTQAVMDELSRITFALPPGSHLNLAADLSINRAFLVQIDPPPTSSPESRADAQRRVVWALHGSAPKSLCMSFDTNEYGPFWVFVNPNDGQVTAGDLRKAISDIPYLKSRLCEVGEGHLLPFPVRLALVGPDPEALKRWGDTLKARVTSDGIALDVDTFPDFGALGLQTLVVDKASAAKLGVSTTSIDDALFLLFGDATVSGPGGQVVRIRMSVQGYTPTGVGSVRVDGAKGQHIPLSSLVQFTATSEPWAIFRVGSSRAVRLTASPPPGVTSAVTTAKCLATATAEREKLNLSNEYRAVDLVGPAD